MRIFPALRVLASFCLLIICLPRVSESASEDDFLRVRLEMVRSQLAARGITDRRVLDAMSVVPRHLFISPAYRNQAYRDYPLPIDEGQTISQPFIVALMSQLLGLKEGDKVLEIGTGSGYQAAVLAHLTDKVYSVEIRENLAKKATEALAGLNYSGIQVKWADGYFGWEENGPFDAIIITCAANHIPPPLLKQLKEGGRLVIPLGSTLYFQTLTLVTMKKGRPEVRQLSPVRFVPMIGEADKKAGQ